MAMQVKLIIVAALVAALIAFWNYETNKAFEAGVNSQRAKDFEAHKEAIAKQNEQLSIVLKEKEVWRNKAVEIQNNLNKVKKVNDVDIQKAANTANCRALGNDYFQLWNSLIEEGPGS